MGICRLCGLEGDLIDSHYMPAAIYKSIRRSSSVENMPSLIVADSSVGSAFTDKQVVQKLLCSVCEQRFSREGERYVSGVWSTKDDFALRSKVRGSKPYISGGGESIYRVSDVLDVNHDAIFYFVLSVIWRGSFSGWKNHNHPALRVGRYREEISRFLQGNKGGLKFSGVFAIIDESDRTRGLATFPVTSKNELGYAHIFRIPGVIFYVFLGEAATRFQVGFDLQGCSLPMVYLISPDFESIELDSLSGVIKKRAKPRGRLATFFSV